MAPFSALAVASAVVLAQVSGIPTQQRVTVSTSVTPEIVSPGDSLTLSVNLTPKRDIRLFAPGATDFTPVVLVLNFPRGVSPGKPKYPIPDRQSVPGTKKRVPVYDARVELEQPITISKKTKRGDTITIDGLLTYQTCDDTVTYRRTNVPVSFTVRIR